MRFFLFFSYSFVLVQNCYDIIQHDMLLHWNEYNVQWTSQLNYSATLLLYTWSFSHVWIQYIPCVSGHVSIIFMTMPIKKPWLRLFSPSFYSVWFFHIVFSRTLSQWFAHLRPRFYWESLQFTYQKCNNLKKSRTKLTRNK